MFIHLFPQASRCLEELEVPHFHHELIYEVNFLNSSFVPCLSFCHVAYAGCSLLFQAIVMLLDKEDERVGKKMVKLFKAFTLSNIVTPHQFTSVCWKYIVHSSLHKLKAAW